ncbi:uncharacterized protein [Amphiura filiformis]|uniref:uncharacterized protein isoform X2 n=1 Tax=Amphiura filiformis TaxID=82378 RepID=UPI003B2226AF
MDGPEKNGSVNGACEAGTVNGGGLHRAKSCHSYSRKLLTTNRCDHCKKTMFLVALRCKDCRFKCHRKCARNAPALCILKAHEHNFQESAGNTPQRRSPTQRSQGEFLTPQHHRHHHQRSGPSSLRLPRDSQTNNKSGCSSPGSEDFDDGLPPRPQSAPAHQTTSPRRIPSVSSSGRQSPVEVHQTEQQQPSTRYHLNPEQEDRLKGQFGSYSGSCTTPSPSSVCRRLRLSPDHHRRPSQCEDRDSLCLAPESSTTDSPANNASVRTMVSYAEYVLSDNCSDVFVTDSFGEEPRSPNELSRVERHRKWSRGERSKTVDATSTRQKSVTSGSESKDVDPGKSLIATWPKDEHCHVFKEDDTVPSSLEDAHRLCDWLKASSNYKSEDHSAKEAVKEWAIPHENLKYGKCLRAGRNSATYSGNWHGEVLIHTRNDVHDLEEFLEEVSLLSMIRHENIALFMGACIDRPNLAVVTCVQKGPSLFQQVHLKQSKLPINSKVHIARQIAQGVGYLHARGIVVGHLNSRAVFLESKVKLCMTGYDTTDPIATCESEDYASLPQGHLTYIAPEILKKMTALPPSLVTEENYSIESDVFAFGTILYELLSGSWPFATIPSHGVIYQVCTGKRTSLSKIKCVPSLKHLVKDCWTHDKTSRPTFAEIVDELQQNSALVNMKHSLSEPEGLNKIGRVW